MSWSVNMSGNADEIGNAFDRTREQAAAHGMVDAEQHDIDECRDLAMQFAGEYGAVNVTAWGSWNNFGADDPRTGFSEATVKITAAPKTEQAP